MAQSLGKKVARIFSVLVAALLICSAAFLFTACETDHPKIKMTIEFNDKSYELTYKLYRNMYPKTVAHYLELIDMVLRQHRDPRLLHVLVGRQGAGILRRRLLYAGRQRRSYG